MKYLFLNNENIDVCLPPYLRINITIWLKKNKYQILTYHVNNTYAKLSPDSILNKKIKEALSDLKRPPERLQSQCNYRPFIT